MNENTNTQSGAPAPSSPQPAHNARTANDPAAQPSTGDPHADRTDGFGPFSNREVPVGGSPRAESMSASEIQAEATRLRNDPKSDLWQGTGEAHEHAVAVSFKAYELAAAAEGNAPAEEMTTMTRLSNRAINLGDLPIAKEAMNPRAIETDTDLANAVRYFDSENISTPTLKRAMSSYANMLAATGGRITDAGIAMLEREVGHEFHPQQKALLIRWLKEEVEPNLAKLRRRR